jgi:predicted dehydrogenase
MKQVSLGVIGCGGMGRGLLEKLLCNRPQLRVTALYDPDRNATRFMRDTLTPQARICRSHEGLSASPDVDWVLIASWNCFHKEQAVAAFKAGKHVFCQKPIALSLKDCLAMRDAQRRSGKMFTTGFTLRYSPHYRALRRLIEEGAVGELVSFEFNETLDFNHGGYIMADWRRLRENAGTHLLEKCCHDIDLANWMTDSRARRVASFGGLDFFTPKNKRHIARLGKNAAGRSAYQTWHVTEKVNPFTCRKDIFDNQVAIIEYENGVRATFHTNCNAGIPERRMYILGTEGAIRANVLTGEIETQRIGFDTQMQRIDPGVQGGHGGGDEVLAQELADSMLLGQPPMAGLEAGLNAAVTCFAIDRAADTGRVVDMAPYWARVDRTPPARSRRAGAPG